MPGLCPRPLCVSTIFFCVGVIPIGAPRNFLSSVFCSHKLTQNAHKPPIPSHGHGHGDHVVAISRCHARSKARRAGNWEAAHGIRTPRGRLFFYLQRFLKSSQLKGGMDAVSRGVLYPETLSGCRSPQAAGSVDAAGSFGLAVGA